MATVKPGGFGQEFYGDPLGGGGPINVVRARAVASRVVRVVFSEQPVHQSPAGFNDALNPGNYYLTVASGQGTDPQAVGVDFGMIVPPAIGLVSGSDQRGFDVHVDVPLAASLTYTVNVRNVQSASGGSLGAPYSANFVGVVAMKRLAPPPSSYLYVDIANQPVDGSWTVDDSGDLAVDEGLDNLRKRILRRLSTPLGAFRFLPNYGLRTTLKGVVSSAQIVELKQDAVQQARQEPEVLDAAASVTLQPPGILTVTLQARAAQGALAPISLVVQPNGLIVIP